MPKSEDAHDVRPLTSHEQAALPARCGDNEWYVRRREADPEPWRAEPAGLRPLPLELLKDQSGKSVLLDAFEPEEAPDWPGGPRELRLQDDTRKLRRFSGARVTPAVFTQIYDGESRRTFADTGTPWARIGQISTPAFRGSGAIVGESTVLTASHVMLGGWSPSTFTPAMNGGTSLLGNGWVANIIGIAYWEKTDEQQGYDMAVCQLDLPLGRWLGYFGTATYNDDWEDQHVWSHVGYPYDLSPRGDVPSFEGGIAVEDDDSDSYGTLEVETRADIASGQSGGPLWSRFNDGQRRIIGTLSGREDNFAEAKNSLFAGGSGMVRLVRWARDNWG